MNLYILSISIVAAFFGLLTGSFLNVCIYRIPLNETIVSTPSHCMSCGHKLAWYDLFPLFSYLFLGGKCRYCKAHISMQYPLVEALNSIVWGLTFYYTLGHLHNSSFLTGIISAVLMGMFFSALIVLSGIDIYHQLVFDRVNLFILIIGILYTALHYDQWLSHLIGFIAVSLPLFVLMCFNAMGGGDVKLYAVAGLVLGWKAALISLLMACLVGSVLSLPLYIPQKKKGVKHPHIPFVPFIAIGMFIAYVWTDDLIRWYIATFLGNLI